MLERLQRPIDQVKSILHRRNRHHAPCRHDVGDAHLGKADVPDLAFLLKIFEQAKLILGVDGRVNAVELEQIDRFHLA